MVSENGEKLEGTEAKSRQQEIQSTYIWAKTLLQLHLWDHLAASKWFVPLPSARSAGSGLLCLYIRASFCRQGGPGGLGLPPSHQGFTSPAWPASLAAPSPQPASRRLSCVQGCARISSDQATPQ